MCLCRRLHFSCQCGHRRGQEKAPPGPYAGDRASFTVSPREQGPWPPVGGGMGSRPWLLCVVFFFASNFRFYFLDPGQCLVPTCWGHLGRAFPSCGGTPPLLLFPNGRL